MKLTDERTRFAVAAASMALEDAGLIAGSFDADRAGVLLGTSGSDLQVEDLGRALQGADAESISSFGSSILSGLNPLWLLVNLPNMVSAHVSIQFELRGPNSTVMTDWIAGLQAIGEAASWIEQDEADMMLCGAAECAVLPFVFSGYEHSGLFDGDEPVVFGDAAALFVLEEREHALLRGARIYGEVLGTTSASAVGSELALISTMSPWVDGDRSAARTLIAANVPGSAYRTHEANAVRAAGSVHSLSGHRAALGFPLAAASPLEFAIHLEMQSLRAGEPVLVNAVGFLQQAATLCFLPTDTHPQRHGDVLIDSF
jgi:hypothetical protein